MAPRRRKGQPKGKAQSPSPPPRQVETEETQEEKAQEESREVASVPTTTRSGRPAKTAGTAAADPDSPSDYAQDTDASSEVKKGRIRKVLPYEFSREQEGELVEWYQANPELYDKNCQQYRNKDRKYSLVDNKAKEFPDCTYAQLCQWFTGQRTRYGKLSQSGNKSGSGGKNFTPRQQWIIDKWGFIKSHIVRAEMRQSTKKFDKKKPLPSMSSEEEFDSLDGTSGSTPSTSQQHSKKSRTTANSTAGSIPNATELEERGASQKELIKQLMQQATEAREARQAMTQPQTPHERAVDTFQAFLKTELLKIPENMWFNYTMAAMKVAHNFSHPTLQLLGHMGEQQMGLMGSPHQHAHQENGVINLRTDTVTSEQTPKC
ncbi:uncharacterized protein LOC129696185 isoform X3 [Leucoraja erinacea]|uniref:uncharacterized protein LOC129696185 isoform X3 n=1 Tax=Leucoraja erinaceus TaxID=7782 RepID=UPI0024561976|nr:uncharacterized protein LOC129696185 isoform X3 [Leucoraja erinacea]